MRLPHCRVRISSWIFELVTEKCRLQTMVKTKTKVILFLIEMEKLFLSLPRDRLVAGVKGKYIFFCHGKYK